MKKFDLVTRNLQEVISEKELVKALNKRKFSVYWGTATTGSPSVAYFFPLLKIADFLNAGLHVKILLADLHAALDGVSWKILDVRTKYYKRAITLMLKFLGVDVKNLTFVRGKDIQLSGKYFEDLLHLSSVCSVNNCKRAGSEVVKMSDNPSLGNLIYPLMQALDEVYLGVDAQFAGADQRKIMVYAREVLPKIGYAPRIELMCPMVRGLVGEKMSSSVKSSKIDLWDSEVVIRKKINSADCVAGDVDNGLLSLLKHFIMLFKVDRGEKFVVERSEKFGGDLSYYDYSSIEKDFKSKKLHPLDLKNAVSKELVKFLKVFRDDKKLNELYKEAYK